LQHERPDLQELAVETLEGLTFYQSANEAIRKMGGVAASFSIFQESENHDVKSKAVRLLSRLAVNRKYKQQKNPQTSPF